ncbi:hypothetical protein PI125_g22968 [Phytophthora idaei]|nr:hypothetical protein PI125_g22968 [Phytophthora idaei]
MISPAPRKEPQIEADQETDGFLGARASGELEFYFQTAMDRLLRERQVAPVASRPGQLNRVGT